MMTLRQYEMEKRLNLLSMRKENSTDKKDMFEMVRRGFHFQNGCFALVTKYGGGFHGKNTGTTELKMKLYDYDRDYIISEVQKKYGNTRIEREFISYDNDIDEMISIVLSYLPDTGIRAEINSFHEPNLGQVYQLSYVNKYPTLNLDNAKDVETVILNIANELEYSFSEK